ncbi:MAG: ferritin [Solirubrobacteraceae bacterium]
MPSPRLVEQMTEQIGHEFAAHQQYLACAVHYDADTLPRLATLFYAQALEERNHAMMFVRYLLDNDIVPALPAVPAPATAFPDVVAPISLALEQERRVTEQIVALARTAREDGDFQSEQFLQWFLKEQTEEVSTMSALLTIAQRAADDPLAIEEHLAREGADGGPDPTAPPVAGGAL